MFQPEKPKVVPYDMMQDDDSYNWSIDDMPWKNGMSPRNGSNVVMFNGSSQESPVPSTSGFNLTSHPRMKRKSQEVNYFPSKQLITEEKMSLHLNGIHLSDSFQAHNINISDSTFEEEDMDMTYNVNLSPQELERRLRNAQRITIADDVKKSLKNNDEIIPKVLLDRIEKPCQALVLWQPPQTIGSLLTDFKGNTSDKSMDETKNDDDDEMKMDE